MPALIWLAYLSLLVLSLLDNLRGPFFPDILADLQLDGTWGSTFFATTSLFAFIGSWTSHRIVHRHSSLFLLGFSSVVLAVGFALMSRALTLTTLLPACALFGWGFGALNLAQNVMVYEGSAPRLRRRLFSGLHSMYGLAALLAPVVASLFRWLGATWRDCFFLLALLPVLVAMGGARLRTAKTVVEPTKRGLEFSEWIYCALFSCMMAFYLWGEISATTRMVQWLRADLNFSPDQANLYLGGFSLAILLGRIFFSFMHFEGVDNWRILLVSSVLSCGLYLLGLRHSPLWFLPCGLAMSPFFPVAMEQVSVTFAKKNAEALGFVLGAGSLSVVVMHLTLGVMTDAFGVGNALYIGPVSLLIVAVGLIVKTSRAAPLESR